MNDPYAVVVIDMQKAFFLTGRLSDMRADLVSAINKLTIAARDCGVPVVWVRQEHYPDGSNLPLRAKQVTPAGHRDSELLPELIRDPEDYQVIKTRFSAFHKTGLLDLLERLGARGIVIAGVNTMSCVRCSAIDAYQNDFDVILAEDAVNGHDERQHLDSMTYMKYRVVTGMNVDAVISSRFWLR